MMIPVDLPSTSSILQIGSADLEPFGAAIMSARRSSFGRSKVPYPGEWSGRIGRSIWVLTTGSSVAVGELIGAYATGRLHSMALSGHRAGSGRC